MTDIDGFRRVLNAAIKLAKRRMDLGFSIIANEAGRHTLVGRRIGAGRALKYLLLQHDKKLDENEVDWFIDILTNTITYKVAARTREMNKILADEAWYHPPSNLRRETMLTNAYDTEGKTQEIIKQTFDKWTESGMQECKDSERIISYTQAFLNASGARALVQKDIEKYRPPIENYDDEKAIEDDANNILLEYSNRGSE